MTVWHRLRRLSLVSLFILPLVSTMAAPSVGAAASRVVFADGFESGYGAWTRVAVDGGSAYTAAKAAHVGRLGLVLAESTTRGSVAYVRRRLSWSYADLTMAADIRFLRGGVSGSTDPVLRLFDAAGDRVLSLDRVGTSAGGLQLAFDGGVRRLAAGLPLGVWARVAVHVYPSGASSRVLVSMNGRTVFVGAAPGLHSTPIAAVQLGDEDAGGPFVLDADSVAVVGGLAAGGGTLQGCATLQGQIERAAAGSILDLTGCTYDAGATVTKPLTIKGANILVPAGQPGLTIASSDVVLDGLSLQGPQSTTYVGAETGIYAPAVRSNPLNSITIRNSAISGFGFAGIDLDHVTGATITGNAISDVVYAGILILSGTGGRIADNTIERVGVHGSATQGGNAYGIALSDTRAPATSDFAVTGNTITDVPTWHGLDTHGGQQISFSGNIVSGSMRALFITADDIGNRPTGVTVTQNSFAAPAPATANDVAVTTAYASNVTVTGNTATGWPRGQFFEDYRGQSTGLTVSSNTCDGGAC